jgi:hypothetical protein
MESLPVLGGITRDIRKMTIECRLCLSGAKNLAKILAIQQSSAIELELSVNEKKRKEKKEKRKRKEREKKEKRKRKERESKNFHVKMALQRQRPLWVCSRCW